MRITEDTCMTYPGMDEKTFSTDKDGVITSKKPTSDMSKTTFYQQYQVATLQRHSGDGCRLMIQEI